MIPEQFIFEWENQAPWQNRQQVEQDLILSRAIIEIFSDDFLKNTLLFRGGTALYKLYVPEPVRYSEDLDFVMIVKGPIGPVYDAIRGKLNPLLGEPDRDQKESMAVMSYSYNPEFPPHETQQSLKLEINYEEDFTVLTRMEKTFEVDSRWFSGNVEVPTFKPDELMATKFRALFQRNKGRDLFDLWFTITEGLVTPKRLLDCFKEYTANLEFPITRARFEKNLTEKTLAGDFGEDIKNLLAPGVEYDFKEAVDLVHEKLIKYLPGDPYKGEDNIF